MVVSLAGLAALTLFEETPGRAGSQELRTLVLLLIVMVSVCLVPAMTMLSRSQLVEPCSLSPFPVWRRSPPN